MLWLKLEIRQLVKTRINRRLRKEEVHTWQAYAERPHQASKPRDKFCWRVMLARCLLKHFVLGDVLPLNQSDGMALEFVPVVVDSD